MEDYGKKRILVVEDDEDVITYLSTWLSDQGFDVDIARDGLEATEKVKYKKPDLITLDIVMPGKTGVKFYRETRKDAGTADIPIIVITGLESEFKNFISHRRTAPPPDGYIQKPFSQDDLMAEISKVFGKTSRAGGAA